MTSMEFITGRSFNEVFYLITKAAQSWPKKTRRGGELMLESPGPVHFCITDPRKRVLTVAGRRNSLPATVAETLWVFGGKDDIEFLQPYLPRAKDYSDDGKTWRAAYGPRLRTWYHEEFVSNDGHDKVGQLHDQLQFVVDELRRDPSSRRAVITLLDPAADHAHPTAKDFPCTQSLIFMPNHEGRLDLHVTIRSNDFVWGLSGVNVFEFTLLQEIVALCTDLPLGRYFQTSVNLHVYPHHQELIQQISEQEPFDVYDLFSGFGSVGVPGLSSLDQLDELLKEFFKLEHRMRFGGQDTGSLCFQLIKSAPYPLADLFVVIAMFWLKTWTIKQSAAHLDALELIQDPALRVGMTEWLYRTDKVHREVIANKLAGGWNGLRLDNVLDFIGWSAR